MLRKKKEKVLDKNVQVEKGKDLDGHPKPRKDNSEADADHYRSKHSTPDFNLGSRIFSKFTSLKLLFNRENMSVNEDKTEKPHNEVKNITVPNYDDLKLTLKGKYGYLFLINDSNNEIYQHFEESYKTNFDSKVLLKDIHSKKAFCSKQNIDYHFFIVPDKSLVCKDLLPFEVNTLKRNVNSLKDYVPDFIDKLEPSHYFKNDTHINYLGGMELSYNYLNHIDKKLTRENFDKLIDEQVSIFDHYYSGDLTWDRNWSYSSEERDEYLNEKIKMCGNRFFENVSDKIPEEFKFAGRRETSCLKNPKALKNLRVLILRDSSMVVLIETLSVYFSELLLYYDHWFFNKELVEWYKPDMIIEIRTERFLENMKELVNTDI